MSVMMSLPDPGWAAPSAGAALCGLSLAESKIGAKPPQNIRIPSNGISGVGLSFISASMPAWALSAVARSGHSIQENSGTSPSLASVAR